MCVASMSVRGKQKKITGKSLRGEQVRFHPIGYANRPA